MQLQLNSKGQVADMKRLYPFGMSPQVMQEILSQMRLALHKRTQNVRAAIAAILAAAGSGVLALWFLTSLHHIATQNWSVGAETAADIGIGVVVAGSCWFALSATISVVLRKHFPAFAVPLYQKTGKTGAAMLAAILVAWTATMALAAIEPDEMVELMKKLWPGH
jgi:hypothetical protein